MPHSKQDVVSAIKGAFPNRETTDVLELLDAYGGQPYERERERVQIAIVTLSEGDEAKLRYFIEIAKRDYRDVLFWADRPEEAKLDTPAKRRAIRESLKKLGVKPPGGLKE